MEQINIGHDLTDEETLTVIRREVKKRNSSIQEYEKFGKTDTVQDLKHEVEILESYLPAMLSDEEVEKIIDEVIETFENPDIKSMGKIISLVKEKTKRYSNNNLLTHLIGYIKTSENEGVSGIEKYMNDELKDSNNNYISVFKAGINSSGLNYLKGSIQEISNEEKSTHIKLTIDSKIQEKVEKIMDKENNPSAVVISKVENGEVIAMCSRPNFNQNKISSYHNSTKGELQNRVLSVTYPPGSVFKLVVLYAALENNAVDENYRYYCTGSCKIGSSKSILKCNNNEAHGMETLSDALSNSCNCAFYDIAKKVGSKKIFQAIKQLHLDEKVNLGIDEEKDSKIPQEIALSNLAIGQADIEFTPLQINQLTQIISNNGTYMPLKLYDSIIDNNKNSIKTYKTNKKTEIIAPYTMTKIKEMMMQVSKVGTAKTLVDLDGGCGVKTGTAQSSLNGKKISHGWITGFYPEINPKYAITVIIEGTEKESKSAIPIFKEICENLK